MEQMEKSTGRTIVRPVGKMRPLPIRRLGRTHMVAYCNTSIPTVLSIYFVPPSIRHNLLFSLYTHCSLWGCSSPISLSPHTPHPWKWTDRQQAANMVLPQMQCCARALQNCTAFTSSSHLRLYVMRWVHATLNIYSGDCVYGITHDIAGGLTGTCHGTSDSTGQLGHGGRSHSGAGH